MNVVVHAVVTAIVLIIANATIPVTIFNNHDLFLLVSGNKSRILTCRLN